MDGPAPLYWDLKDEYWAAFDCIFGIILNQLLCRNSVYCQKAWTLMSCSCKKNTSMNISNEMFESESKKPNVFLTWHYKKGQQSFSKPPQSKNPKKTFQSTD